MVKMSRDLITLIAASIALIVVVLSLLSSRILSDDTFIPLPTKTVGIERVITRVNVYIPDSNLIHEFKLGGRRAIELHPPKDMKVIQAHVYYIDEHGKSWMLNYGRIIQNVEPNKITLFLPYPYTAYEVAIFCEEYSGLPVFETIKRRSF